MKTICGLCFLFFSLSLHAQQTIQISGVAADASIQSVSVLRGGAFRPLTKENGVFKLQITASVPTEALLSTPGSQSQAVYMTPGDSLSFVVRLETMPDGREESVFHFTGRNAAHYNYSYRILMELGGTARWYPRFRKGEDITEHKRSLVSWREKKMAFLEKYRQTRAVSDDFYNHSKNEIDHWYVYALHSPIRYKLLDRKELPEGYLDPDVQPYSADRYIYCYTDDLYAHFDTVYNHIIRDAPGKERERLLTTFIGLFAAKGESGYYERLMEVIEQAPAFVRDTANLAQIDRARKQYEKVKHPFPDAVLFGTRLKAHDEDRAISLKELLARYEGKPVYIDFWATWCVPCRQDIARSKESKAYLEERGIAYVYFAVRDNEEQWREVCEELGIDKHQYFLLDSGNSPLEAHVSYREIPRYLLLNARHDIENLQAPRPTPEQFDDLKRNVENMPKPPKVYRY
jgi:thiol-disulfide isomerase/thioredoxin